MRLAHHEIESRTPTVIALAELTVLIRRLFAVASFGRLDVLGPQQLQRHARATELLVHPLEVDGRARERCAVLRLCEQTRLELGVGERLRVGPRDRTRASALEVVADGAGADPTREGDLPVGTPALELQPKDFTNLAHRVSLRHGLPSRDDAHAARVRGDLLVLRSVDGARGRLC